MLINQLYIFGSKTKLIVSIFLTTALFNKEQKRGEKKTLKGPISNLNLQTYD